MLHLLELLLMETQVISPQQTLLQRKYRVTGCQRNIKMLCACKLSVSLSYSVREPLHSTQCLVIPCVQPPWSLVKFHVT